MKRIDKQKKEEAKNNALDDTLKKFPFLWKYKEAFESIAEIISQRLAKSGEEASLKSENKGEDKYQ